MDWDDVFSDPKKVVALLLFSLFVIWAVVYIFSPIKENQEAGAKIIEQASIPWWVPLIDSLSKSSSIFSAFAIIILVIFLLRKGKNK